MFTLNKRLHREMELGNKNVISTLLLENNNTEANTLEGFSPLLLWRLTYHFKMFLLVILKTLSFSSSLSFWVLTILHTCVVYVQDERQSLLPKIHRDVEELRGVLHETVIRVHQRDENLDELKERANQLARCVRVILWNNNLTWILETCSGHVPND